MTRSTTRLGTLRFPETHSPFWLVVIAWENERCPTCERKLPLDTQAAFDDDEQACFCITCARKWLDRREDDDSPPARAHPKTWRPTPLEPF